MPKLPSVYKRPRSPVYWGSVLIKGKRKQFGLCENKAAAQRMLADIKERLKGQNKYGATTWTAFKKRYLEWAKANKSPQTAYRDGLAFDYLEKFRNLKSVNEIDLTFAEDFKTWLKNTSNKLAETYNPKKEKRRSMGGASQKVKKRSVGGTSQKEKERSCKSASQKKGAKKRGGKIFTPRVSVFLRSVMPPAVGRLRRWSAACGRGGTRCSPAARSSRWGRR